MSKILTLIQYFLYSTFLILSTPWVAHAIPFSSDISISGSIVYDNVNSYATGTTQSGSISSIIGETKTTSNITGAIITGTNPLAGTLTDIGDGFGSIFSMSGDQNADKGELFSDYAINITNNSATDQFMVSFLLDFTNIVDANGADSFADSQFSLSNDTTTSEIFFTDLTSDIFFGDKENGISLASFGASLSDTGMVTLDFLLTPLAVINLSGINQLQGGVFDDTSDFEGELTSFISLASVTNLTTPPSSVPEPVTFFLIMGGFIGLFFCRAKQA